MNQQISDVLTRVIKYLVEGGAVALAMYLIPNRKLPPSEIVLIALTAAAVMALLDTYSPSIADGFRRGAGFGLGAQQVRFLA